ncbi:HupE/UreJ family protein [Pseudoduganella chitinolytica]|uniref:HupE/UreJ family protein n=1 Tax=Pseudoduganella chitinolytica TaxID=34070 RepID=A0ABY8BA62_9BURK|nr:HupE/UreJ family protein [Pseudoduganella chitinolytica]WEF31264.1 HupE/UreJ family protein [Pseudoduganella chitinolytica]
MKRRSLVSPFALLLMLLACLLCEPARAHKPSDSYLTLRLDGERVEARWDIALRDLDFAMGIDANDDGRLTWDEIRARHDAIAAYALARLRLSSAEGGCPLVARTQLVDRHTDGAYTVLTLEGACRAPPTRLLVDYRLFADTDAQHRGLLRIDHGATVQTAILGGERPRQALELEHVSAARQFLAYVWHGMWHIWIGFDHILFLVSLLLPAVLARQGGAWVQVADPRSAAIDVIKTVSAFTAAHSVTLALAALDLVSLPSRWVESAIALSVVLAALNNVWPRVLARRWLAALAFGLVHGFGFAGVLADLGLPRGSLALSLLGFNVGVELGQLAIVAVVLPVTFLLRGTGVYRRVLMPGGSLAIALVALVWLGQRAFDFPLA